MRLAFWLLAVAAAPAWTQAASRLPLPVTGPASAQVFETTGPAAAVLTGFLVPSAGPLTSWAPLFRTLGADGRLGAEQSAGWNGPLPSRWIKVARAGSVVAGMRVLLRTSPAPVQTRQFQVFWQPWSSGQPRGRVTESGVYGQAADARDTVRIVELRVPEQAVAVGFYGELLKGLVVQTSLLVRLADPPPQTEPSSSTGPSAPVEPVPPPLPNAP